MGIDGQFSSNLALRILFCVALVAAAGKTGLAKGPLPQKAVSPAKGPFSNAGLWDGLKQTAKFEPQTLELTSTAVMTAGFVSAALL